MRKTFVKLDMPTRKYSKFLKVEEFRDMIVDIRNEVYKMIREGLHLDEIIAAEPTAPYDGAWENDPGWTSKDFIPVVYYELGGGGRLEDR